MKRGITKLLVVSALTAGLVLGLAACGGGSQPAPADSDAAPVETEAPAPAAPDQASDGTLPDFRYQDVFSGADSDPVYAGVYDYLAMEKLQDVDPAHTVIPYAVIVGINESDPSDVLIYGDYYCYEFALEGDVLAVVSGGHVPGVIHAERSGEGASAVYTGRSMEEALTPGDAPALFGDHLADFEAISSDDQTRAAAITQVIADYVQANGLAVTGYHMGDGVIQELS